MAADVVALHGVAQARRAARLAAGALRLDNTSLDFHLAADGYPASCTAHVQQCAPPPALSSTSAPIPAYAFATLWACMSFEASDRK